MSEAITKCESCVYFDSTGYNEQWGNGACRIRAPKETDWPVVHKGWPVVHKGDGCGEGLTRDEWEKRREREARR